LIAKRSELDLENETGGQGGALPLESAYSAGVEHEADAEEAQRGVQGEGGGGGNQGRPHHRRVGGAFGVHPNHIHNWKKQLLDGAVSVFEGGASAEGGTNEAQVDLLYRQIGQLKVENDLYEGLGVKRDAALLCEAVTAAL